MYQLTKSFLGSLALLLCCLNCVNAQEKNAQPSAETIREKMLDEYASRYPLLRQGFIGTDFLGKGYIKAKFQDEDIFKGDAKVVRIRSNFNIPVSQWGKNKLTGSVSYMQQRIEADNIQFYPKDQSGLSGEANKAAG